jgi:methyl-accepting chemotaxis protein
MIQNISIKYKLILSFTIVLLLFLGVAVYNLSGLNGIQISLHNIVNDRVPKVLSLQEINNNINQYARSTRSMLLLEDLSEIQKEKGIIKKIIYEKNPKQLEYLKSVVRSEKGKDLLSKIVKSNDDYILVLNRYLDQFEKGRKEDSRKLLLTELRPKQHDISKAIEEFSNFQIENLTTEGSKGDTNVKSIFSAFIIISIVVAIIIILITFFTANSINKMTIKMKIDADVSNKLGEYQSKEVVKLVDALDKLEKGNTNIVIKTELADKDTTTVKEQFEKIYSSLSQTVQAINLLIVDANMLSKAAVEGRLATRADATKHKGEYKTIVEGVNDTINSLVGFLENLPAPVMIINRDFEILFMNKAGASLNNTTGEQLFRNKVKCFDHFKTSDCKTDKCACAQAMEKVREATSETDAHPGNHNLDIKYTGVPIRNKEGLVVGAFEVVMDQTTLKQASRLVTKIADYQAVETKKVTDNLVKLSQGNISITAVTGEGDHDTLEAKQKFDTINQALAQCVNAITSLINEMNLLSSEHLKGEIDARIDNSKFEGAYRKMADGVNILIGSEVDEKKKIVEVIGEYGKGNFTIEMPKLPGKKIFINQNLDLIKKNMESINHEIHTLIEATLRGELSIRGNSSKFEFAFYRDLVDGINKTLDALVSPMQEITLVLSEMAKGNLKVKANGLYKGDHAIVANALNETISSFNSVLLEIQDASSQILQSASQLADSSQMLANGSSEQASSLEEVTASVANIEEQTKQNAVKSEEVNSHSQKVKDSAMSGNKEMEKMVQAMEDINVASSHIAKIIKEIDAIAFQTNILALNAAVEAARAGEHGRGFNVVAEEVRNLASRSAKAAQETANLIEETQNKITGGVKIAQETAIALGDMVKGITQVTVWVDDITNASKEQSAGITQLNTAITQISQVTMSNAATSEEGASASQELQSQAEAFQNMVKRFSLDNRIAL